jgi:hypothetical protein
VLLIFAWFATFAEPIWFLITRFRLVRVGDAITHWQTDAFKAFRESSDGKGSFGKLSPAMPASPGKKIKASKDEILIKTLIKIFYREYSHAFVQQIADLQLTDSLHEFWESRCDVTVQSCSKHRGTTGKLIPSSKNPGLRKLLRQMMIACKIELKAHYATDLASKPALQGKHTFALYANLKFETPKEFLRNVLFSGTSLQRMDSHDIAGSEEFKMKLAAVKITTMHLESFLVNQARMRHWEESPLAVKARSIVQLLPMLFTYIAGVNVPEEVSDIIVTVKTEAWTIVETAARQCFRDFGVNYENIKETLQALLLEPGEPDADNLQTARASVSGSRSSLHRGRGRSVGRKSIRHRANTAQIDDVRDDVTVLKAALFGSKVLEIVSGHVPKDLDDEFAEMAVETMNQGLAMAFSGSTQVPKNAEAQAKTLVDGDPGLASCLGPQLQSTLSSAASVIVHRSDSEGKSFKCAVPAAGGGKTVEARVPSNLPSAGEVVQLKLPAAFKADSTFIVIDPKVAVTASMCLNVSNSDAIMRPYKAMGVLMTFLPMLGIVVAILNFVSAASYEQGVARPL